MNVLFHIDEPERWPMVLANVGNMLAFYQGTAERPVIEIVANGPAVAELKASPSQGALHEPMRMLSEQSVDIAACRNALRSQGIAETELLPFVRTVPAGVVELAVKQGEGYAYIKP